ncbi:hypothetical protein F5J12DRAFT_920616 [Pisolithus orientalis]|uniref:uncharacterized protein n=1 Tax=Pisolithus orientalis TaxID=936130 RepID=UPI0022254E3E|nr:uncharacterized protein F5J12DRAFT_920616 [Pisolithus orientalis]KAI6009450.1 hypothetical protein F5J12DRAFT_920616 [Pisolithus orientalis]
MDNIRNKLLGVCPLKMVSPPANLGSIAPANKHQGFGFVDYEDPDLPIRCVDLLNGIELPARKDGCANNKLLVLYLYEDLQIKADEIHGCFLRRIFFLVKDVNRSSQDAPTTGQIDEEHYVILSHLYDPQEPYLPEGQWGLKVREVRENIPHILSSTATTPSGPKMREWGKPLGQTRSKPVGFVKVEDAGAATGLLSTGLTTDEELRKERREAKRRDEEILSKNYEPRIAALEWTISLQNANKEAEECDWVEMQVQLDDWDDDESD